MERCCKRTISAITKSKQLKNDLAMTIDFESWMPSTQLTVDFQTRPNGCRVIITHEQIPSPMLEQFRFAWEQGTYLKCNLLLLGQTMSKRHSSNISLCLLKFHFMQPNRIAKSKFALEIQIETNNKFF